MSSGTASASDVVRARRYVSAPEGAYPEPLLASEVALGVEELAEVAPAIDPAATVAVPLSVAQAAHGLDVDAQVGETLQEEAPVELVAAAGPAEALEEMAEEAAWSGEHAAPFEDAEAAYAGASEDALAADLPFDAEQVDIEEVAAAASEAEPFPEAAGRPGGSPVARLLGGLIGGLLGAVVGLALLALARGGGLVAAMLDPKGLWQGTDDPVLLASAAFVAAGFALFGFALPRGRAHTRE